MGRRYSAFGLTIDSEIDFPDLRSSVDGVADVRVRLGDVPCALQEPTGSGAVYQVNHRTFLLDVHNVGRYLVSNGSEILIKPADGVDHGSIQLFLFGSPFGALLHQRGLLAFHGSAIVGPRGAVIFTGVSGSGKSALAYAFRQRGYPVLSDEICAVCPSSGAVLPGNPYSMLWADTLNALGMDASRFERVRPGIEKYIVPLQKAFAAEAIALRGIYLLDPANCDLSGPHRITGLQKINLLGQNVYRPRLVEQMNYHTAVFRRILDLAAHIPLSLVRRPQGSFDVRRIVDLVEQDIAA